MQIAQVILQRWDKRAARLRPRMEITGDGLALGAGTILAKASRERGGGPKLALHNGPRVMALLATAYERPIGPRVLSKIGRACELWNEGEQALAHIYLAHAGLPDCVGERALRLFAADELLVSGVTPQALLQSQGFDPAPLSFLKYNPDQPRVPAGSGRESGRWTSDGAGGSGGIDATASETDGTGQPEGESARIDSTGSFSPTSPDLPASDPPASGQQLSFTGILIDKRYDEVLNITHCTYSTPLGTYTLEFPGFYHCKETTPVPPGLF